MTGSPFIVFDHDGTLTDPEYEYQAYLALATSFLSNTLGMSSIKLSALLEEQIAIIKQRPDHFGWELAGHIVAPPSDHFILLHIAVTKLAPSRPTVASELFTHCYPLMPTRYKTGAYKLLKSLLVRGNFAIVTNSRSEAVRTKLSTILSKTELGSVKLVGDAKKMEVDPTWEGIVPTGAYRGLPGFPTRGIYLGRRQYYDTLLSLCSGNFNSLIVVGDIGELDLLLPDYLGASTILVPSPLTPSWELSYWQGDNTKKRMIAHNLHQLAKYLL